MYVLNKHICCKVALAELKDLSFCLAKVDISGVDKVPNTSNVVGEFRSPTRHCLHINSGFISSPLRIKIDKSTKFSCFHCVSFLSGPKFQIIAEAKMRLSEVKDTVSTYDLTLKSTDESGKIMLCHCHHHRLQ